jgi:hypothetical protein
LEISPDLIHEIERRLVADRKGVRKNIAGAPGIEFLCPAHDDHHPSAHWHQRKKVWKCRSCRAGGGVLDLCKRLGIDPDMSKPKPPRAQVQPGQKPVRTYKYVANGVTFTKGRYEFEDGSKAFKWAPPFADYDVTVADMPLYWLEDPAQRPTDPVVFCEGEKTTEAVWQRGILATCGAWGASQKNFGHALEELRGREVWLAPDNDEAGRIYMDAVAASLRNIAAKVRWVRVPLPVKGDLFDFFAAGGLPEAIWEGDLAETTVDQLSVDSVRCRVPSSAGIISFEASELTRAVRTLDCKLRVKLEGPGFSARPYSSRINLLSSSSRSQLRLELAKMWDLGKDFNWVEVINDACAHIEDTFTDQDVSVDVFDIEDDDSDDMMLLGDLLPRDQPTVFFGDGASLKSYIALYAGLCVALGDPFPGDLHRATDYGRVLYLDFENVGQRGFRRRVARLFAGLGLEPVPGIFDYWDGRGIPLLNQSDSLMAKVRKDNIRLIIVDSAAPAAGGKPEDAESALGFFNAISKLKTSTLVIAHITKEGGNLKPFGSSFWHNMARRTWYIQRAALEGADDVDVGMYCRKVNDGPLPLPKALGVRFFGRSGPVTLYHKSFIEVDRTLDRLRDMRLRLVDALSNGALPAAALADRLGSKTETVQTWLKRYPDLFINMGSDDGKPSEWGLRAREA